MPASVGAVFLGGGGRGRARGDLGGAAGLAFLLLSRELEEAGGRTVLVTAVLAGAAMLAFQGVLRG